MKINLYQTMPLYTPARSFYNGRQSQTANPCTDGFPQDQVTISLFGQNSRIENLIRQRHSLLEQKNNLIHSILESGSDKASIQDLLDTYEEQLKNLDQQITQEMAGPKTEQPDKRRSASLKDNAPKTREELQKERIASLVDLSSGMAQTEAIQSAKTRTEGEARILESEIRMDKGRCGDSESIARREEKLSKLQQRADSLTADIMKLAEDTADRISESNKTAEEKTLESPSFEPETEDPLTNMQY